jgi:hypothetical protein
MSERIRIEIKAEGEYWTHAFYVEWINQFPDRRLESIQDDICLADPDWMDDLNRVARLCKCKVVLPPNNPGRRRWFRSFVPMSDD